MTVTYVGATEQAREAVHDHVVLRRGLERRAGTLCGAVENGVPYEQPLAALREYLAAEILPHAEAEERTLYPAAATQARGSELVRTLTAEHRALAYLAGRLQLCAGGTAGATVAERISTLFAGHVAKENDLLLPALTGSGTSDAYADQISDLRLRQASLDQALRELTAFDVRWACDVLRSAFEATGGLDGRVSIEVDPRIAHDTQRTVAEARALWWLVDRPNLLVKIPAARQGVPAISACLAEGISINVTLIFSLARYAEVLAAFLTGLERARDAGRDLSGIASVASFFVSRVDTEVDRRLNKTGSGQAAALRGEAAIANARLAYQRYEQAHSTGRWQSLERAGARPQRPLWASTSVKDPAYEDTRYVTSLVAPGVVNTMPEATLNAVADHGHIPGDSIHGTYAEAEAVLSGLAALGIDYDDVVQILEDQGVAAFDASWDHLGQRLASTLGSQAQA